MSVEGAIEEWKNWLLPLQCNYRLSTHMGEVWGSKNLSEIDLWILLLKGTKYFFKFKLLPQTSPICVPSL